MEKLDFDHSDYVKSIKYAITDSVLRCTGLKINKNLFPKLTSTGY